LAIVIPAACSSGNGASDANLCSNGTLDGTESDVDCGGTCGACAAGRTCFRDLDCASGVCAGDSRCADTTNRGFPNPGSAQTYTVDSGQLPLPPTMGASGFAITAAAGGGYRLVWSAAATAGIKEFSGTIWTTQTFDSFATGCSGDCVVPPGQVVGQPMAVAGGMRLDFHGPAVSAHPGFEFTVTSQTIYWQLMADGQPRPDLVFFSVGGAVANPTTDPFALTQP
jgi:hypothetical protein